jgi:hypothetical protein
VHRRHARFAAELLRKLDAARRRIRVQLVAVPVQIEIVFPLQPDQAALLRDEAERSDEIGEERQGGSHPDQIRAPVLENHPDLQIGARYSGAQVHSG